MGMSASQARLLSITARMSDNENTAQSLSYSKQRLADQTQQLNTQYNEALDTTKLSVITGYNNGAATYTDISYNLLTDSNMLSGKQYVVTDAKNRVLVDESVAKAYELGNGDFNIFLAEMGYSQSDMTVQYNATTAAAGDANQLEAEQKVHEAWDDYYATIGINLGDMEHDVNGIIAFGWTQTTNGGYPVHARNDGNGNYLDADGNITTYTAEVAYDPINYEGTTNEQRKLYDYAVALTNSFMNGNNYTNNATGITGELKTASDPNNNSMITYYRNLFNRMALGDYFAYTQTAANTTGENGKHYEFVQDLTNTALKDNSLFEGKLKKGELSIECFSSSSKCFVSTALGSDQTIVEVEDEKAIAKAEREYEQNLTNLENQDKKFDLQLNKLDTEHNALQTEYESVKTVIDKNVEKSFNIFS